MIEGGGVLVAFCVVVFLIGCFVYLLGFFFLIIQMRKWNCRGGSYSAGEKKGRSMKRKGSSMSMNLLPGKMNQPSGSLSLFWSSLVVNLWPLIQTWNWYLPSPCSVSCVTDHEALFGSSIITVPVVKSLLNPLNWVQYQKWWTLKHLKSSFFEKDNTVR